MSVSTSIYFLAILVIGLPSALRVTGLKVGIRNATALAMVVTWLFGQAIHAATGEWLPVKAMVVQDMFVIAAMLVKDDWATCSYRNTPHQLACLWLERTPWDRAILALFPAVWLFYLPIANPDFQYWVLYLLGLGQLILAGLEAAHPRLELVAKQLRAFTAGRPPPGSEFHSAWRWAGHG